VDRGNLKHCIECGESLVAPQGYCDSCGASAPQPCYQCGCFNPAKAKFCGACGDRLSTLVAQANNPTTAQDLKFPLSLAKSQLTERKFATVLAVDMVGSLSAIRDADPEEAHDLFSFGISLMTNTIHDYGGTIFANTGDGVLAMFGAPDAQADHPIRCCHAALKILQRLTEARKTKDVLEVRIGIHSGEVAFGMSRTDLAMNYDLTGATVHIASRLQNSAPHGGAVMSAASKALVGNAFESQSLGMVDVRGLSKPVELYKLGKPGAQAPVQSNSIDSIFVGRTKEVAALGAALDRANQGLGAAILVEGEAGIGKTHLVDRFVSEHSASATVGRISIDRYRDNAPFYAVRNILLGLLDLMAADPAIRKSKITEIAESANEDRKTTEAALCELFELENYSVGWQGHDARTRNRLISNVIIDQLTQLARTQTLVVIVEDIQWMDSCSLDVIGQFIDVVKDVPTLVIMTCRTGTRLKWKDAPKLSHIPLAGLSDANIDDLVERMMGSTASPAFRKQLVGWSRGNPLFLCEVVRTLMESEAFRASPRARTLEQTGFEPPESVRGIVAERIDRMPADLKDVLLAASVLGERFEPEVLGAIVDAPRHEVMLLLKRLEGFEFIRETSGEGRSEFVFRHPLFQEVSYATVLKKNRIRLHASAYREISASIADAPISPIESLAHHAFNGALWNEAAKNCHVAGKKALDRLAAREASHHLQNALTSLGKLDEYEDDLAVGIQVRLELRTALIQLLQLSRAENLVSEAHEIAVKLDDRQRLAETVGLKALHEYLQRGPSDAKILSEKSITLATALEDRTAIVAPSICLAQTHYALGQFREAISAVESIIPTISEFDKSIRLGLPASAPIIAWYWIAISNAEVGEFKTAETYIEKMQSYRLDLTALDRVFVDTARGFVLMTKGDYATACDASMKAWELSESADVPYLTPVLASQVGLLLAKVGEPVQAIQLGKRAVETALEIGVFAGRSRWCARLAEIYLTAKRTDEARENVKIAIDVSTNAGELSYLASGLQLRARLASEFGEHPSKAYTDLKRAILIARKLRTGPAYARCLFDLSLLERSHRNLESAQRKIANARRQFERLGMMQWAERAEFEQKRTICSAVTPNQWSEETESRHYGG